MASTISTGTLDESISSSSDRFSSPPSTASPFPSPSPSPPPPSSPPPPPPPSPSPSPSPSPIPPVDPSPSRSPEPTPDPEPSPSPSIPAPSPSPTSLSSPSPIITNILDTPIYINCASFTNCPHTRLYCGVGIILLCFPRPPIGIVVAIVVVLDEPIFFSSSMTGVRPSVKSRGPIANTSSKAMNDIPLTTVAASSAIKGTGEGGVGNAMAASTDPGFLVASTGTAGVVGVQGGDRGFGGAGDSLSAYGAYGAASTYGAQQQQYQQQQWLQYNPSQQFNGYYLPAFATQGQTIQNQSQPEQRYGGM
ncbi:hypothetical protein BC829DRAFT_405576 [Chytridium lagenaria]|nr:hypothetical protein BC829DRAFT_405576 [Chytridium lagenaria]